MIGLARELEQVEGISFSKYAQTAIIATERYLKPSGLKCAPNKSELLTLKKQQESEKEGTGN